MAKKKAVKVKKADKVVAHVVKDAPKATERQFMQKERQPAKNEDDIVSQIVDDIHRDVLLHGKQSAQKQPAFQRRGKFTFGKK